MYAKIFYNKLKSTRAPIKSPILFSISVIIIALLLISVKVDANNKKCLPRLPETDLEAYAIYNAEILVYQANNYSYVDSMVISDGKFEFIGKHQELRKKYPNIKSYNLNGYTIQPGLIDAHTHILRRGRQMLQVDLRDSTSVSIVCERIGQHFLSSEKVPFIQGFGWDQNLMNNQIFPTYKDLAFDQTKYPGLDDIPISLSRVDAHGVWINKAALNLVIQANPSIIDPKFSVPGGDVIRDSNGYPTGVFIDNAQTLVTRLIPKPTEKMELLALDSITREMLSYGLTGAHDAGVNLDELAVFQKALKQDNLPVRIYSMIKCAQNVEFCDEKSLKSLNLPDKNYINKSKLFIRAIKVVLDGALGSWGAAMIEPYSDKNSTGLITYDLDILRKRMSIWSKMGFQINSHAIGDLANRMALDNYEHLLSNITKKELKKQRHRIEHSQLLTAKDLPRFAELGIIPSMQPTHATSDMLYAEKRIGPERIRYAYAWKSLLKSGVQALPFSSDFPVELVDPRLGLYAAITRLDKNGNSPLGSDGWYKNEAVSPYQALKGFTIDAAFSAFKENEIGSIEIGKLADFIIVKKSWLDIPAKELLHDDSRVRATFLSGKRVF